MKSLTACHQTSTYPASSSRSLMIGSVLMGRPTEPGGGPARARRWPGRQTGSMTARVRAPELRGRGWLNTGGTAYSLADLRGKIVLLDFWTFCCINCLHVIDELRPLEEKYADVLVVVGVHSPKFVHEADPEALAAAVERYEVRPPGARRPRADHLAGRTPPGPGRRWCWSTRRGTSSRSTPARVTRTRSTALLAELVAEHEAKGTLHRGDGPYVPPPVEPTTLRFPAKAVAARRRHTCWSPTPATTGSSSWPSSWPAPVKRQRVARDVAARFNEPNGLCCSRGRVDRRTSPTPSTTSCAASPRRPAR